MFFLLVECRRHFFLVEPLFRLDGLHQAGITVKVVELLISKGNGLLRQTVEKDLVVRCQDECRVVGRFS